MRGTFIQWKEETNRLQRLSLINPDMSITSDMTLGKFLSLSESLFYKKQAWVFLRWCSFHEWSLFLSLLEELYILVYKKRPHCLREFIKRWRYNLNSSREAISHNLFWIPYRFTYEIKKRRTRINLLFNYVSFIVKELFNTLKVFSSRILD